MPCFLDLDNLCIFVTLNMIDTMRILIFAIYLSVLSALSVDSRDDYTLKNLGIVQGLSCNYVNALEEDKDGFNWVATE